LGLIFCGCGCGGQREEFDKYGQKRKFIAGHQNRGRTPWIKGKHLSEKSKQKMSDNHADVSGENNPMFGKYHSDESKQKMSDWQNSKNHPMLGKHPSNETIQKISDQLKGDKHPNWKGGITPLTHQIRESKKYFEWQIWIKEWDNYTCQKCGVRGGELHSHHIKPFNEIIKENNIKSVEEAKACTILWDVGNGITYCDTCHNLLLNKGGIL